jgi:hypothetical protein
VAGSYEQSNGLSKPLLSSQRRNSPELKRALVSVSTGTLTGAKVTGRGPIINIPGRLSTSLDLTSIYMPLL